MSDYDTGPSLHSMIDVSETSSSDGSLSESSEDSQSIDNMESDTEYDTTEYDSETEEMVDRIYFHEEDFLDSEKEDKHYYIGNSWVSQDKLYILYANAVTPTTFFRFDINHVKSYLHDYSIFPTNSNIDIMKLFILDDHTYTVIIKTYWLKIIQRHWKKVYSQRKYCISRRRQIKTMMYVERNGMYPYDCHSMPGLQGMLSGYTTKLFVKCR